MRKSVIKSAITFITLVFLIFYGCRKNDSLPSTLSPNKDLIEEAKRRFSSEIDNKSDGISTDNLNKTPTHKLPQWQNATVADLSFGKAVLVPLKYSSSIFFRSNLNSNKIFQLDEMARLLVYKGQDQNYHYEVITSLPDSNYIATKAFSGIELIEDWQGQFINEYKYEKGNIKKLVRSQPGYLSGKSSQQLILMQTCYTLEQYVYAINDPYNGVYSSRDLGCNITFIDNNGSAVGISGSDYGSIGSGGSSGNNSSTSNSVTVNRGNEPVTNILQYIKCFQNTAGATYSVSLVVDQPVDGQRATYSSAVNPNGASGLSVGHTFLIFQESQSGLITRRSLGFYPSGLVTPMTPNSPGSLNNDEGHPYDISLSISLTGSQFMSIMNAASNGNNIIYNLNTENCTTWALSSLAAGGININSTPGNWPFGHGYDPGDLGEDIRKMTLPANMSRTTNFGYSAANLGICP